MADLTTYGAVAVQGLTLEKLLRVISDAEWIPTALSCSGTLTVDTINEYTGSAGVTIDGVLVKDGSVSYAGTFTVEATGSNNDLYFKTDGDTGRMYFKPNDVTCLTLDDGWGEFSLDLHVAGGKALSVDTINEKTGAAGVTIDGVTCKDGAITLTNAAGTTSITFIATTDGVTADPTTDTPESWLEVNDGGGTVYIPCYTIGGA